jgi:transcriptional regulator with XRE-family HTH domain
MKKIVPNGRAIKQFRTQLEKLSTQKEMANQIGVSIRMLRKIENENAPIATSTADRLAKALNVHRQQVTLSAEPPTPPSGDFAAEMIAAITRDKDQLVPRHDYGIASATTDEGRLFAEGASSHDLAAIIETPLTEETGAYVQELIEILSGLTWSKRSILKEIPPEAEIALRRRIRQLAVLLKGNDIWVYETSVHRTLPERYTVAPDDEPCTHQKRFVVAFAPAGEYGETTWRVPIDHGQPFILPSWNRLLGKKGPENVGCN